MPFFFRRVTFRLDREGDNGERDVKSRRDTNDLEQSVSTIENASSISSVEDDANIINQLELLQNYLKEIPVEDTGEELERASSVVQGPEGEQRTDVDIAEDAASFCRSVRLMTQQLTSINHGIDTFEETDTNGHASVISTSVNALDELQCSQVLVDDLDSLEKSMETKDNHNYMPEHQDDGNLMSLPEDKIRIANTMSLKDLNVHLTEMNQEITRGIKNQFLNPPVNSMDSKLENLNSDRDFQDMLNEMLQSRKVVLFRTSFQNNGKPSWRVLQDHLLEIRQERILEITFALKQFRQRTFQQGSNRNIVAETKRTLRHLRQEKRRTDLFIRTQLRKKQHDMYGRIGPVDSKSSQAICEALGETKTYTLTVLETKFQRLICKTFIRLLTVSVRTNKIRDNMLHALENEQQEQFARGALWIVKNHAAQSINQSHMVKDFKDKLNARKVHYLVMIECNKFVEL